MICNDFAAYKTTWKIASGMKLTHLSISGCLAELAAADIQWKMTNLCATLQGIEIVFDGLCDLCKCITSEDLLFFITSVL